MGQEKVVDSYVVNGLEVAGLDSDSVLSTAQYIYTGKHASQPWQYFTAEWSSEIASLKTRPLARIRLGNRTGDR